MEKYLLKSSLCNCLFHQLNSFGNASANNTLKSSWGVCSLLMTNIDFISNLSFCKCKSSLFKSILLLVQKVQRVTHQDVWNLNLLVITPYDCACLKCQTVLAEVERNSSVHMNIIHPVSLLRETQRKAATFPDYMSD